MKANILFFIALLLQSPGSYYQKFGAWAFSSTGLPVYQYTGAIPARALDKDGKDAGLPEDPYFLLGNYRITLITHVSGIYQFITAERAWARINAAEQTNYGWNSASIIFNSGKTAKNVLLTGLQSVAADTQVTRKAFGAGFARYTYQLDHDIVCTRIISLKPSPKINTGNPSFTVTVTLKNNGKKGQELTYSERMAVNFVLNSTQYTGKHQRPLLYSANSSTDKSKQMAVADLFYKANSFLVLPEKSKRFMYDVDPPSVFMYSENTSKKYKSVVLVNNDTLTTNVNAFVQPGETKSFHIVIGLSYGKNFKGVQKQVDDLFMGADLNHSFDGLYARQWKLKLPDLSSEKNEVLRREMLWNAHMMEASAKYSEYYRETIYPAGFRI